MPPRIAQRLRALPSYLFREIERRRQAAEAAGRDVIDFGVGDPDRPTPAFILDAMSRALRDPACQGYPPDTGTPGFRSAAAAFFHRRYGLELDPQRELIALIGTKEGLAHLPLALVDPGQTVLVPDPAYPVYRAATVLAGGTPWPMPLRENNQWLPVLDAIPPDVARSAALMFLNYPNNPTGAVASLEFYERVVHFARRFGLVVAQDAAYNELYLTADPPPSLLQVPGARDVAVEFHSLSKTFNMSGWRIGLAVGNAAVIEALARVKSNIDSGVFKAIQEAGRAAYEGYGRPEIEQARSLYRERSEVLCAGLRACGFRVSPAQATFYVWAAVPDGYDDVQVACRLLDEAGIVCIPGSGFGSAGAGYVRFALTVDVDRIRTAITRLSRLSW